MQILEYIPVGREKAITREELVKRTGLDDRQVRELIQRARRDGAILNLQDGRGYFRPDCSKQEEVHLLERFVRQEEHRLKSIGWALRGARRILKGAIDDKF